MTEQGKIEERRRKSVLSAKKWQLANPDRAKNYWRSPKSMETRKNYYNSEKGKAARRRSYDKNREKINARNAVNRKSPEGRAWQKNYVKTYYQDPLKRIHKLVLGARTRSKNEEIEFDEKIFDDLKNEIPTHCPCCRSELEFKVLKYGMRNPSIDRVDSTLGYVRGNVRVICWRCNILKADGSIMDFENILAYMRRGPD